MKKIYIYLFIATILLPFRGNANQLYEAKVIVSKVAHQEKTYNILPLPHSELEANTQQEPDKPKVQLFPNPNQGEFTLKISDDIWQGATATLHNIIGLEVDRRTVLLGENNYNIPECQPGIYFLTLQRGDLQKVLRFVKR